MADEIEIWERYDPEEDIYYVSMKTPEPSIAREVDDTLLVEFGIFTDLPTGFRILNYTKHKVSADAFKDSFTEVCKAAGLRKIQTMEARKRRFDKFFETVGT